MPLTALKISKVKPDAEKTLRLFDGRGLYLEIAPSGGKWWRLKYRICGKEKRLSLGVYTAAGSNTVEVSLEVARKAAEDARQLVRDGVDPSQNRKAETTVHIIARMKWMLISNTSVSSLKHRRQRYSCYEFRRETRKHN